jgi:hypothetical protein
LPTIEIGNGLRADYLSDNNPMARFWRRYHANQTGSNACQYAGKELQTASCTQPAAAVNLLTASCVRSWRAIDRQRERGWTTRRNNRPQRWLVVRHWLVARSESVPGRAG